MPAPPINLFSRIADPAGVLRIVIAEHPDAKIIESPDGFQSIEISRKLGFFKGTKSLQINHSPDYYTGASWKVQQSGMAGYFDKFPMEDDRKAKVMTAVDDFAFSLAFLSDPPVSIGDDDFRFELILKIAKHLDACFFLPGYLLDSQCHILIDGDGEFEQEAEFPKTSSTPSPAQASQPQKKEDIKLHPPTPQRIAARALALAAVSARGMMELNASEDESESSLEDSRKKTLLWCSELSIDSELEPLEREALNTPIGELSERLHLDSIWRFEGLAVLLWALQISELPKYDALAEPDSLLPAIGFLDHGLGKALLQSPQLRSVGELNDLNKQLFTYHWRLREFQLRPKAMDFQSFGETAWFGPLDLTWAGLDESNDLTLQGTAIHEAKKDTLSTCSSIANERHQASNWLKGYSELYSETDTST
jgi:hypothetical protein